MRNLLIFAILLLACTAQAQTVQQDNALVFYFDEGATVRAVIGSGELTAYLIAGPMIDFAETPYGFMNSWGANGMSIEPFGNVSSAILTPRGAASPASFEFTSGSANIGVLLAEPLPLSGRTVLAELTLMVTSSATTYLTPCYANGGSCDVDGVQRWFETLYDETGAPALATAAINGEAPLATSTASWSGVKALFR